MVKRIQNQRRKIIKLHVTSLHIINPPRFRYATLISATVSARSNQSQETKSMNRIEEEEEKKDENPDHSKEE